MKKYEGIVGLVLCVLLGLLVMFTIQRISSLESERDEAVRNNQSLLEGVTEYKVRDSLNASKVHDLELSIDDWRRLRAEDAQLIKDMGIKNSHLASVISSQMQTTQQVQGVLVDTMIIHDSIPVKAQKIDIIDKWVDVHGVIVDNKFDGVITTRDSLVLVETIQYKRFLGFLWKTKRIKSRELDVVSKNPCTSIIGIEKITLQQ